MTSVATTATVAIPDAPRYLRQLCRHFGHKVEATFEEHGRSGTIQFEGALATLGADDAQSLVLTISDAADADAAARYAGVLQSHLERFAFREELAFTWSEPAAVSAQD